MQIDSIIDVESVDLTAILEKTEAAAFRSFYEAASSGDRAAMDLDCSTDEGVVFLRASRLDVLAFNRILGLGVDRPATKGRLEHMVASYRSADIHRIFIPICPSARPQHLHDWLIRLGCHHHNNWIKLFRGVEPIFDAASPFEIREIHRDRAVAFAHIVCAGFRYPDIVHPWIAALVGRPDWRIYGAFQGDTLAGGAAMHIRDGYAYFGFAATDPEYCRRGAQQALLARRIREAARSGCRLIVAETAETRPEQPSPSLRNCLRAGFNVGYVRPNFLLNRKYQEES